jgi:hypothetical protein
MDSLKTKYTKNPITADIYTVKQLKIALDDVLVEYCQALGYKENHLATDFKNVVGIISALLASFVLALGYLRPFQEIKMAIAISVSIFFAINFLVFIFCFIRGDKTTFENFDVSTKIDQTKTYNVVVYPKDGKTTKKYNKSVFDLFYEDCRLDHVMYLNDLENLFKN